ncbi:MAG TPA: DNA alkylation repair protein [Candidatus Aquicultor sp.]|jgi:3-methyladenine DNA glycosylase AlkD
MPNDVISAVRDELTAHVDEATKNSYNRFFKEEVSFYGVKSATVGKIAKRFFADIKDRSEDEIFALCEELLQSDYTEEAFIAFDWTDRLHRNYRPSDFETFERWILMYVNNWAKCDTFCNHTVGSFVEQYPKYVQNLKTWTQSDNRWLRRASAVTLILPARNGMFLDDVFEIADLLLQDNDDLVQKGYGWMLKEASKAHRQQVFEYIIDKKAIMPRTALRYAIEKMPDDLRRTAMQRDTKK